MLFLEMVRLCFACVFCGLDGTAGAVNVAYSSAAAIDDADLAAAAVDDANSAAAAVDDAVSGWPLQRSRSQRFDTVGEVASLLPHLLPQYTTMSCSFFLSPLPGCTMACFTAFVNMNLQ